MKHNIHHGLSHELARKATQKALESYQERFAEYKPRGRWVNDDRAEIAFTVAGKTLEGTVDVGKSDIGLELEVPFVFLPFRGRAMKVIEDEIQQWIQWAREGRIA